MKVKLVLAVVVGTAAAVLAVIFDAPRWVGPFFAATWFLILDDTYGPRR